MTEFIADGPKDALEILLSSSRFRLTMREFPKIRGTLFWGPYIKDLGCYIRVPFFSQTPVKVSVAN